MPTPRTAARRALRTVALLACLVGTGVALSGCIIVPAGGYYHPHRYYSYPY